jgi:hypothetical protein
LCWTATIFKEIQERFRYLVDRAFAREFTGQLLLFAVLVVLVTLIGMTAIFFGLFSEENAGVKGIPSDIDRGPLDALWWVLNYVIRLPAFQEMYGASVPILIYSTLLSIMGLAVFGMLVSLINNAMRERIERLRRGDALVKERGHVLLLGWNNKVFSVLRQIASLEPGARVVILAREEVDEMIESLRIAGIPKEPISVILRSGIPTNGKELERVALDRAAQVIVLSGSADDSDAIKTLVLLANWSGWRGPPPTQAAEIALHENYELAEVAGQARLPIVSSSRVTSKIIVQTLRNPGLAAVYDEIMSPVGNSIFVQHLPELAGETLGSLAYRFERSVPIGISWTDAKSGQFKAGLNLEPDYDLADDESLVFLARGGAISAEPQAPDYQSDLYREQVSESQPPANVLFIGWSDTLLDILSELNAHATMGTEVTVLSRLERDAVISQKEVKIDSEFPNLNLSFVSGDATQRSGYTSLELAAFDSIAVLAETMSEEEDPDTQVLRTVLRLSELVRSSEASANIVVEIFDVANREIFARLGVHDVVVSTEVISAQLAQVARQPVLGAIYGELLSAGGVEIALRPITHYVQTDTTSTYWDMVFAAQQRTEVALGLYRLEEGVLLNPDRTLTFSDLTEADRLIVLAEQIYR